jgi:hypothetical protein
MVGITDPLTTLHPSPSSPPIPTSPFLDTVPSLDLFGCGYAALCGFPPKSCRYFFWEELEPAETPLSQSVGCWAGGCG